MRNIIHPIVRYFDKFEDRVRGRLSKYPIIYSLIGGTAIVLFWRGVWETADEIALLLPPAFVWIDGPLSVFASVVILLATGLFVSFFVSDQVILSGIRQEKKLVEKTAAEVREEESELEKVRKTVQHIEQEIDRIEHHIE